MNRRRFLSVAASGAAVMAMQIAGRAGAVTGAPVIHIHLVETFRAAPAGEDFRFLLLRAVGVDGERFARVLDIAGIWPEPVSFVAERGCAIEQFELLDPGMRWIVRGDALDGSGGTPALAAGQTAMIWTISGGAQSPRPGDPADVPAVGVERPGLG